MDPFDRGGHRIRRRPGPPPPPGAFRPSPGALERRKIMREFLVEITGGPDVVDGIRQSR
ncbi:hypothetical protein ACIF80_37295 [Streptomyces sp. NPDC085927]|uniref:hypothetical protein n=1 Tax=Streptomyces sp. NPDC085927 TaxID=3365738 RepID=UPI0037CF03C5